MTNALSTLVQSQAIHHKTEIQGRLTLGETQVRTLVPGTIHVWTLSLKSGQYAAVKVLQKGIDVVIRIVNPRGEGKGKFNSPEGTFGKEKAAWISESVGTWKVEIIASDAQKPGIYEIKWAALHQAAQKDRESLKADSLSNMALAYYIKGEYLKSESLYVQSQGIRERIFGLEHLGVADSFNDLAEVYRVQSKDSLAESLFRKSLMIREKLKDTESPEFGLTLNSLALLYKTQAKYAQADSLYRQALKITEKALDLVHCYLNFYRLPDNGYATSCAPGLS